MFIINLTAQIAKSKEIELCGGICSRLFSKKQYVSIKQENITRRLPVAISSIVGFNLINNTFPL
jgi:hypothetical protein